MTPVPASRRASSFVNSTLASFETEYSPSPPAEAVGRRSASQSMPLALWWARLATFTIRDGALCLSRSRSSSVNRNGPRWFVPKPSSKPSFVRPRCPARPALLTSPCRGSPRERNASAAARTDAGSARSRGRNSTLSFPVARRISSTTGAVRASERPARNSWPPRRASSPAVTRPIPVLAPVTMYTFPRRSLDMGRKLVAAPRAGNLPRPNPACPEMWGGGHWPPRVESTGTPWRGADPEHSAVIGGDSRPGNGHGVRRRDDEGGAGRQRVGERHVAPGRGPVHPGVGRAARREPERALGADITWSTSAPGVAIVSDSGLVTALAVGSADISATSEGISRSASMSVLPSGALPTQMVAVSARSQTGAPSQSVTQAPAVLVRDASGNPVEGVTRHLHGHRGRRLGHRKPGRDRREGRGPIRAPGPSAPPAPSPSARLLRPSRASPSTSPDCPAPRRPASTSPCVCSLP